MGLHRAKTYRSPYRRVVVYLAVLAALNVLIWTAGFLRHG